MNKEYIKWLDVLCWVQWYCLFWGLIMVDFIISLKNGEKYHLKTEYKRVSITNKMALYYYIEVFSQCSRHDIIGIKKAVTEEELDSCSLIITVTKKMVKRFNKM